jgi:hypothetical protein
MNAHARMETLSLCVSISLKALGIEAHIGGHDNRMLGKRRDHDEIPDYERPVATPLNPLRGYLADMSLL